MPTYIALLRGINVSGQKLIPKAARNETDEFVIAKAAVYILVRAGYGKTQFSNNFVERKLKVRATSRNLESSLKLIALAESL